MEYRSRRRPAAAGRSGRNKKDVLSPPERRRLMQLGASIALFLLVFVGRGIFPEQTARWQGLLARDTDFQGAFSRLGAAVSRGEPLPDILSGLWTDVFAGGTVTVSGPGPEWDGGPTLAQRVARQLARPEPVLIMRTPEPPAREGGKDRAGSGQSRMALPSPDVTPEDGGAPPDASGPEEGEAAPGASGPEKGETSPGASDPENGAVTPVSALRAETPAAQTEDEQGRALPGGVSMAFCELGLAETTDPVQGVLTSDYGYRDHPVTGDLRFHRGVDLGAASGTAITAFAGGRVVYTGRNDSCGLYFLLDHGNGVSTFYCHCSELKVLDGQTVELGQVVAKVGQTGNATGPHLHFAVIKDGVYLDPLYYIGAGRG